MSSLSSLSLPPLTSPSSPFATQQRRRRRSCCFRRSSRVGGACVSLSSVTVLCSKEPKVVVTRERGKNSKLINALVNNTVFIFSFICWFFNVESLIGFLNFYYVEVLEFSLLFRGNLVLVSDVCENFVATLV